MDDWSSYSRQNCTPDVGGVRAIAILREATDAGLLNRHARMGAIVSLIKWCKEDRGSFEMILNELDETERTPAVMELVGGGSRAKRSVRCMVCLEVFMGSIFRIVGTGRTGL